MKKPPHLSDKMFDKAVRAAAAREARGVKVKPTPERIAQAGPDGYQVASGGQMRVEAAPLERLRSRGLLHKDPRENKLLYIAGEMWRADWYESGLSGYKSVDFNGNGGGGGNPAHYEPSSRHIASRRASWRSAREAMTEEERIVVGCIVLDETTALVAGQFLTRRNPEVSKRKCLMLGMSLLQSGLENLVVHYGLRAKGRS